MSKYAIAIILFVCITFALHACKHDTPSPVDVNTPGNPSNPADTNNNGSTVDTSLCFERDILPIFISNCAKSGCHDAASHQEGYVFMSYETITAKKFKPGDPEDTELYEKITEKDAKDRMPRPPNAPLSPQQIALIRNWIQRGAPNTKNCATGCDSTKYTFSADIQPMINRYCKGCHNNITPSGGYSYETYAGILVPVQSGRLLGAVKRQAGYQPMPRGGNKLSDCQIKQIEKWIADGAPNN